MIIHDTVAVTARSAVLLVGQVELNTKVLCYLAGDYVDF